MDFAGFPDFGIWTKQEAEAPYICLEPWFGVDSSEGDDSDFERRKGFFVWKRVRSSAVPTNLF